jgi:hypothetical protein
MEQVKGDTNQNIGTVFFIILFLLFILAFSGNSEYHVSSSSGYHLHDELVSENFSIHTDATVFNAVIIPDLYKACLLTLRNTVPELNSSQYIITCFNQRTTQDFIAIQKTMLEIKPLLLRRLNYPHYLCEKEVLPVLS